MVELKLSDGAAWVIDRLPEEKFLRLKKDLEDIIYSKLNALGYDAEIEDAFRESSPVNFNRN